MSAPAAANVESFIPLNGSAGNSAPVTGGRRHKKSLKLVTRKQARKILKGLGKKMRGGQGKDEEVVAAVAEAPAVAGRRRGRKTAKKSKRSLFGLKY